MTVTEEKFNVNCNEKGVKPVATRLKAAEHRRTPKRKRIGVPNDGHVLECGSVLPLLDRRVSPARINPTEPKRS